MHANIEALHFRNIMDLEEYINHPEEKESNEVLNDKEILALITNLEPEKTKGDEEENESNKEEDDTLSAVEVLEQYLMQQDVGEVAWSNHDQALSNLQKEIRKLQNSSFKQ
ncbi:17742_t:CDS:2, partial [Gigaspora margarita]